MARLVQLQSNRTYATERTLLRQRGADGRFFPVFIGERACQRGMHFHFPVVF